MTLITSQCFDFGSKLANKRIYKDVNVRAIVPEVSDEPLPFRKPWDRKSKPMKV